jgi:hypothetical protein
VKTFLRISAGMTASATLIAGKLVATDLTFLDDAYRFRQRTRIGQD